MSVGLLEMDMVENVSVLLLEDNESDAEVVSRFVILAGHNKYKIEHVTTMAAALDTLESKRFDLILLDLNLPDSRENQTFEQIYAREKVHTPVVVMTGLGDEDLGAQMVRRGAIDFLVKGRFDAYLLSRVMRFARERFALLKELTVTRELEQQARERETRERELRILAEMADPEARTTKAIKPLCESAPTYFTEIVRQYESLLEMAIERRVYRDRIPVFSQALRTLACELGSRRASPKDLVELHSRALQTRITHEVQARNQAFIEEGRILLLELMGYIIEYYRAPTLSAT